MTWTVLWLVWLAAFAVIEGLAIRNDASDHHDDSTLSSHLRRWFSVDTHLGRTAWLIVSGVFMTWFVVHIAN